jgi:hypothetical protein
VSSATSAPSKVDRALLRFRIMAFTTGVVLLAGTIALILKEVVGVKHMEPGTGLLWLGHGYLRARLPVSRLCRDGAEPGHQAALAVHPHRPRRRGRHHSDDVVRRRALRDADRAGQPGDQPVTARR